MVVPLPVVTGISVVLQQAPGPAHAPEPLLTYADLCFRDRFEVAAREQAESRGDGGLEATLSWRGRVGRGNPGDVLLRFQNRITDHAWGKEGRSLGRGCFGAQRGRGEEGNGI